MIIIIFSTRNMLKWWAQYLESTGDMEGALNFYEKAGDTLALVRVHCYCEKYDLAAKIAADTGDKASCYHLARQLENADNITQAIQFFTKAQAYGNAIRLCKVMKHILVNRFL
jgi:intraflagellar transport protein 140